MHYWLTYRGVFLFVCLLSVVVIVAVSFPSDNVFKKQHKAVLPSLPNGDYFIKYNQAAYINLLTNGSLFPL